MTTNQDRALRLLNDLAENQDDGVGVFDAVTALADEGLITRDEVERLPSWVYDHEAVWTSPYRQGGSPCVRGTRVNVGVILDLMDGPEGMTDAEIIEYYPVVPADRLAALRAAARKNKTTRRAA